MATATLERMRKAGVRRAMVEANLDLVPRLARRFRGRVRTRVPLDDLESAAAYGLVAAAAAHRGARGGFRRYAASYAWGEMRAEAGRSRSLAPPADPGLLGRVAAPDPDPAAWEDPRLPRLREALKSIPVGHREVIRSLLRGDMPGRIARRLGVGRATVGRRRDEAIGRLRVLVAATTGG